VYLRSVRVGRWDQAQEMHADMMRWSSLYDVGWKMRSRLLVMADPKRYVRLAALHRRLPACLRGMV